MGTEEIVTINGIKYCIRYEGDEEYSILIDEKIVDIKDPFVIEIIERWKKQMKKSSL